MITLIVLFGSFAVLQVLSRIGILFTRSTNRDLAAYAMAIFMIFFGISHFYKQEELILMLPAIVPFKETVIFATGIIEIVLAFGLLFTATRRWAGIILALYFVAVFPANLFKAMNEIGISGTLSSPFISWIRLAFQPLFIVWTLYASKQPTQVKHTTRLSKGESQ